jgi:hypothetical protein
MRRWNIAALSVALIGICNAALPPLADQDKDGAGLRTFFAPQRTLEDVDYGDNWRQINKLPKWNDPRMGQRTLIIETIPRTEDYEAANEQVPTRAGEGPVMVIDGGTYYEDGTEARPADPRKAPVPTRQGEGPVMVVDSGTNYEDDTEVRPVDPRKSSASEGEGPVIEVNGEANADGSTSAGGQWQEEGMNPIVQPVPEQQPSTNTSDAETLGDAAVAPSGLIDGESQQPTENGEQPQGEVKPAETAAEATVDAVDEENAKLAAAEEASATEAPKTEVQTAEKKEEETATEDALKKMEASEVQVTEKAAETTEATKVEEEKKEDATPTEPTEEPVAVAVMDDVTKVEQTPPAVATAVNSTKLADEIVMLPMPAQAERFNPSLRASRV